MTIITKQKLQTSQTFFRHFRISSSKPRSTISWFRDLKTKIIKKINRKRYSEEQAQRNANLICILWVIRSYPSICLSIHTSELYLRLRIQTHASYLGWSRGDEPRANHERFFKVTTLGFSERGRESSPRPARKEKQKAKGMPAPHVQSRYIRYAHNRQRLPLLNTGFPSLSHTA